MSLNRRQTGPAPGKSHPDQLSFYFPGKRSFDIVLSPRQHHLNSLILIVKLTSLRDSRAILLCKTLQCQMSLSLAPVADYCRRRPEKLVAGSLEAGKELDGELRAEHSCKKKLDKQAFVYFLIEYALIAGIAKLNTLEE